jgi:hypothetical protein
MGPDLGPSEAAERAAPYARLGEEGPPELIYGVEGAEEGPGVVGLQRAPGRGCRWRVERIGRGPADELQFMWIGPIVHKRSVLRWPNSLDKCLRFCYNSAAKFQEVRTKTIASVSSHTHSIKDEKKITGSKWNSQNYQAPLAAAQPRSDK